MTEKTPTATPQTTKNRTIFRDSAMVIMTIIFILLYAAAYMGKFDPLKDNTMLLHLEPVIFIFIGYYFGRYPSRRNESTLRADIERQTQRADAAQYSKENAQKDREQLEERLRNTQTALKSILSRESNNENTNSLKAVIKILDS